VDGRVGGVQVRVPTAAAGSLRRRMPFADKESALNAFGAACGQRNQTFLAASLEQQLVVAREGSTGNYVAGREVSECVQEAKRAAQHTYIV
jgi:hypothetical protein